MYKITDVTAICKTFADIGIPKEAIEVARSNVDYYELDTLKYVVDISSASVVKGVGGKFYGATEQMLDQELRQATVTVNIYGKGAYQKAQELSLLLKTQNSILAQRKNNIIIRDNISITDLKNLIGTQQKERVEITFNIAFINEHIYSTKRVDSINWDKKHKLLIEK